MNIVLRSLSFSFILLMAAQTLMAQEAITPRPSPTAIVTMKYHDTYVKVTYSQPHKRGRKIFGGLVPFGHVWRTGANEATEITTTHDIDIQGNTLPAGTYSIFTIPRQKEWTVIINKEVGLWGSYNYNQEADVMRFDVPVQTLGDAVWEPFTIGFTQKSDSADLVMKWDQTQVSIPLLFK